eukprot:13846949-Heterocapsa_arctica.AAC.1
MQDILIKRWTSVRDPGVVQRGGGGPIPFIYHVVTTGLPSYNNRHACASGFCNYVGTTSNEMLPLRTRNKSRVENLATLRWKACPVTLYGGRGVAPLAVVWSRLELP